MTAGRHNVEPIDVLEDVAAVVVVACLKAQGPTEDRVDVAELVDTEDKIQAARRFYNGGVREFNTKILVFPNNMWARRLNFGKRDFFDVADAASIQEPPRVQF